MHRVKYYLMHYCMSMGLILMLLIVLMYISSYLAITCRERTSYSNSICDVHALTCPQLAYIIFIFRYLVDVRWFKQWKKYVGFESWDQQQMGLETADPGPVDTSCLFKGTVYVRM